MTVLIIGLGSMGKRRINLLRQHFPNIDISGVDKNETRCRVVSEESGVKVFTSIHDALAALSYDCVFICSPPVSHAELISLCLSQSMHVFSELNLVSDGYRDNMQLAEKHNKVLFLSSTFLYRNETRFLIEQIKKADTKLNYTYHVGQYLPDWHPWEDYQNFFVADKRSNGCREIFAIELPWLLQAFGKVSDIKVNKDTISGLSLNYPDNYLVTLVHESGHKGLFMVDVVTRVPVRHFEVFGEFIQLEWRGKPEELWAADESFTKMEKVDLHGDVNRKSGYREFITEDAYLEEIKMFFELCNGKENNTYGFAEDLYTLELIDKIEGLIK